MENNKRVCLKIDPIKYIEHRDKFINKSRNIINSCLEMDEELIQMIYDEEFIFHFDDDGKFLFASEEAHIGYFHIDTSELDGDSQMDLAMHAEFLITEHLNLLEYIVETLINESLNNLLN